MDDFIARENIRRFKEQLDSKPDERTRAMLQQLIAIEEARLRQLLTK